ncbi:MAG TPA: hypothetical protein VGN97_15820 [Mesorhizobium sp.]|nr:hypothetical protein [Mesorhizobium sp.]
MAFFSRFFHRFEPARVGASPAGSAGVEWEVEARARFRAERQEKVERVLQILQRAQLGPGE